MLAELKGKRESSGLELILKQALGDPLPDLAMLRDSLAKGIDVSGTTTTITETLHLTLESFGRLMAIKDEDDKNDPSNPVSDAEWDEVYAILTQAWKVQQFPTWKSEENSPDPAKRVMFGPQQFWIAVTEPTLRQWLASAEARQQWHQALRTRSAAPLIDSDLIGEDDLKDPTAGKAFDLLTARRDWVLGQLDALRNLRS